MFSCQSCKKELKCSNFGLSHTQPKLFVTSQWCVTHHNGAFIYIIYRLVIAIYFVVMVILSGVVPYDWYSTESNRIKWFIYLTNWSFLTLTIDVIIQLISAICSYAIFRRSCSYDAVFQEMPWYLKLQWVISNIAMGAGVLVTFGFWVTIYTPGSTTHYIDFNTHTTNSIYLLVNLFITAVPIRLYHCYQPIIFTVIYFMFTAIYQSAGGTNALDEEFIYDSLDWNNPGHAILTSVVFNILGLIAIWLCLYGLYRLRLLLFGVTCEEDQHAESYTAESQPFSRGMDEPVVKYTT